MTRAGVIAVAGLVLALACEPPEPAPRETPPPEAGIEIVPIPEEADESAAGAADTLADTTAPDTLEARPPSTTRAPSPPGGYAVETRPAEGGRLAKIVYASPRTVPEVAEYYDERIQAARRVEIDRAGDNFVVYGLSPTTSLGAETIESDVARQLEQRTEPMVVVEPWTVRSDDPLVRELRDAGLHEQADSLLETRSKVTIVYAVRS